jgi:hypothetical protein
VLFFLHCKRNDLHIVKRPVSPDPVQIWSGCIIVDLTLHVCAPYMLALLVAGNDGMVIILTFMKSLSSFKN